MLGINKTMPPRLFKYEPATLQSLRNLKTQTIYFGSPKDFNDPYDCALAPRVKPPNQEQISWFRAQAARDLRLAPVGLAELAQMPDEQLRDLMLSKSTQVVAKSIQEFFETKGVTCFSETNESLLMWSHYASRGQGLCLEFDTAHPPFDQFRKVEYESDLPEIDLTKALIENKFDEVLRLYCTKSKYWEYEKEWRGIHQVAGTKFTYDSTCLKAVYFGTEAPDDLVEITCLILQGQNQDTRFFHSHRNDSKFGVRFEEFTYTSHIESKQQGKR
jgi:hypothetical protein